MRYGSVCSGIEAATMAWHNLGWEPVFFSEIERFPSAVLAHHYGSNMPGEPLSKNGIPNYGDFTQIPEDAGPIDLLVGGTPCQSFSVAGKRLGLDDPRGNLALEYLALARRLRARWIVWENVPGVVSSVTDEEDGEGGVQSGIEGREAGDEWVEESDFATFLQHVLECGYGFAYRVLDAQYVRVDGHSRAVPQRRRRVFVVGYLGDWRRAAAVLLEPEGMRGDPAPRREAGQGVAGAVNASAGRRGGVDDPERGKLITEAFGGGNTSGSIDVSTALTAHGQRIDFEVETFVAECAGTMKSMKESGGWSNSADHAAAGFMVAHTLKADGFDASEDGTGRGTPIVPVVAKTLTRGAESSGKGGYAGRRQEDDDNIVAIPFDTTQITSAANRSSPKAGDPSHPLSAMAHPPAVAFNMHKSGNEGSTLGVAEEHTDCLRAFEKSPFAVFRPGWAVRRLTPRECERLQGFPDDFTNVPWNGKPEAADGPRYKALGNSMAVNVMRWIGQRIDIMEKAIQTGKVPS